MLKYKAINIIKYYDYDLFILNHPETNRIYVSPYCV